MTTHHHLDHWRGWVTICHSWHAHGDKRFDTTNKYRCFMSCMAQFTTSTKRFCVQVTTHPATLINLCSQSIHILYSNQYSICPKNTDSVWNSKCMRSLLLHLSLPLQALDMLAVCSFRRWRPRWALAFKHNQETDVQTGLEKSGHYIYHYILPTQTYNY